MDVLTLALQLAGERQRAPALRFALKVNELMGLSLDTQVSCGKGLVSCCFERIVRERKSLSLENIRASIRST